MCMKINYIPEIEKPTVYGSRVVINNGVNRHDGMNTFKISVLLF